MKTFIQEGCKDFKTMNLMLLFLRNIAESGVQYANKIINETCIMDVLRELSALKETSEQLLMLQSMTGLIRYLLKSESLPEDIKHLEMPLE